jgi:transcriptional regulator of acetoin/glycerol metabolism
VPALAQLPRHVSELFDVPAERLFEAKASRGLVSLRLNDTGSTLYARVRPPPLARMPKRQPAPPPRDTVAEQATPAQTTLSESDALERSRIVAAMSDAKWRTEQAAKALGMSRATLYRRIAKLGILPPHKC